jgi:predicted nucleic acid-binding Zn ribbon protein
MGLYRRSPKLLSSVLTDFLGSLPNKKQLKRSLAAASWAEIAGERIAGQTKSVTIEGTKLVVTMSSSLWRHEVHAQRYTILSKIHTFVQDDVFTELFVKE